MAPSYLATLTPEQLAAFERGLLHAVPLPEAAREGLRAVAPETATQVAYREWEAELAVRNGPLGDALRAEGASAEREKLRNELLDGRPSAAFAKAIARVLLDEDRAIAAERARIRQMALALVASIEENGVTTPEGLYSAPRSLYARVKALTLRDFAALLEKP